MTISRFYTRVLPVAMLILVLVSAAYAFADTNTVPDTNAGDGAGTISGYTVSAIKYNLNTTNPQNIDSVQFSLTPTAPGASAPTTVKVQLNGAGSWFTCTLSAGTWTCNLTGVTVVSSTNLRIVAAQ